MIYWTTKHHFHRIPILEFNKSLSLELERYALRPIPYALNDAIDWNASAPHESNNPQIPYARTITSKMMNSTTTHQFLIIPASHTNSEVQQPLGDLDPQTLWPQWWIRLQWISSTKLHTSVSRVRIILRNHEPNNLDSKFIKLFSSDSFSSTDFLPIPESPRSLNDLNS